MDNVTKAKIVAYTDKDFRTEDKKAEPFIIPVNPESYTQNFQIKVEEREGQGNQKTAPKYVATAPEKLRLDFVLDGTGTIEGYTETQKISVHKQIKKFKELVYFMDGDKHRPRFIKVLWGMMNFQCIIESFDINFTLFDKNGYPLRAKISATFLESVAAEERIRTEGKNSPDLSHARVVKEGDRLDLMTYKIYNDSKYFLQIAKANGLTTLRQIKSGRTIMFPPFDKTEV